VTPVLHVLAGPNGSGRSTFVREILRPVTHLPFVNADELAAERWPGREEEHAYEASRETARRRDALLAERASFITETVFSHPSKVDLVRSGVAAGYLVALHVMLLPVDVTMRRVAHRVETGGHTVPPHKIRERYDRLWPLVVEARHVADRTTFYDNGLARSPFRVVATYRRGRPTGPPAWPAWAPEVLR
jgi:predicted ABC-type ATPase